MPLSTTANYANVGPIRLAADVPNGGTLTIPYPIGTTQADFTGANAGLQIDNMALVGQDEFMGADKVGFTYNANDITVTNNTGFTWTAAPRGLTLGPPLIHFGLPRGNFALTANLQKGLTPGPAAAAETFRPASGGTVTDMRGRPGSALNGSGGGGGPVTPPTGRLANRPIIYDDDLLLDHDAAGNAAMVAALWHFDNANFKAFTAGSSNIYAAPILRALRDHYEIPETVLIGAYAATGANLAVTTVTGSADDSGSAALMGAVSGSTWGERLLRGFGKNPEGDTRANYPEAYKVWRQIFADEIAGQNRSIALPIGGGLSNVYVFARSPADEISPLTGAQMLAQNKPDIFAIIGRLPATGGDYNSGIAAGGSDIAGFRASAAWVLDAAGANIPCPITVIPQPVFIPIGTAPTFHPRSDPAVDPVMDTYVFMGKEGGRPIGDSCALLRSVLGQAACNPYFNVAEANITITCDANGSISKTSTPNASGNPRSYLGRVGTDEQLRVWSQSYYDKVSYDLTGQLLFEANFENQTYRKWSLVQKQLVPATFEEFFTAVTAPVFSGGGLSIPDTTVDIYPRRTFRLPFEQKQGTMLTETSGVPYTATTGDFRRVVGNRIDAARVFIGMHNANQKMHQFAGQTPDVTGTFAAGTTWLDRTRQILGRRKGPATRTSVHCTQQGGGGVASVQDRNWDLMSNPRLGNGVGGRPLSGILHRIAHYAGTTFPAAANTALQTVGSLPDLVTVAAADRAPVLVRGQSPVLSGTPQVGQTMSCSTGTYDGVGLTYTYQWYAANVAIAGATQSTYSPVAGDVGKSLACGVIVTAANGAAAQYGSNGSAPVVAA